MAERNLELRSYWETMLAKLRNRLDDAETQRRAQASALQAEQDALLQHGARVTLANHKYNLTVERTEEIKTEIEKVEETIEALRDMPSRCHGCGLPEGTVQKRSNGDYLCNDCAHRFGVK
jgi:DNA repair exonuclease SbcCD ATPase subunit